MRYANKIEFFEKLEEEGKPTPLSEMPEFDYETIYYINAFHRLSGSRQTGFGIGSIPFSEIKAYIDLFGCFETYELFIDILMLLDSAFLEYHNNINKSKQKVKK